MADEDEGDGRKNRTKDYSTPTTSGTQTVEVNGWKCQIEILSANGRTRLVTYMPIWTVNQTTKGVKKKGDNTFAFVGADPGHKGNELSLSRPRWFY
jgi:hypothetical protein